MRILTLIKQILLDLPDYFRSHPVIFFLTMAFFLFMLIFVVKGQRLITSRMRGPAKLLYQLIGILGAAGILLAGLAFNTAGEYAKIHPAYVTRGLYLEFIAAGVIYIALIVYLEHVKQKRLRDAEVDDDSDPGGQVLKTGAMILFSILGLFLGERLASWGFSLFGRTIGAWIYGVYLGHALYVALQLVLGLIQIPLMLLTGDPFRQMEAGLDEAAETPGTYTNRLINWWVDRADRKEERKNNRKNSSRENHSHDTDGTRPGLLLKWQLAMLDKPAKSIGEWIFVILGTLFAIGVILVVVCVAVLVITILWAIIRP